MLILLPLAILTYFSTLFLPLLKLKSQVSLSISFQVKNILKFPSLATSFVSFLKNHFNKSPQLSRNFLYQYWWFLISHKKLNTLRPFPIYSFRFLNELNNKMWKQENLKFLWCNYSVVAAAYMLPHYIYHKLDTAISFQIKQRISFSPIYHKKNYVRHIFFDGRLVDMIIHHRDYKK